MQITLLGRAKTSLSLWVPSKKFFAYVVALFHRPVVAVVSTIVLKIANGLGFLKREPLLPVSNTTQDDDDDFREYCASVLFHLHGTNIIFFSKTQAQHPPERECFFFPTAAVIACQRTVLSLHHDRKSYQGPRLFRSLTLRIGSRALSPARPCCARVIGGLPLLFVTSILSNLVQPHKRTVEAVSVWFWFITSMLASIIQSCLAEPFHVFFFLEKKVVWPAFFTLHSRHLLFCVVLIFSHKYKARRRTKVSVVLQPSVFYKYPYAPFHDPTANRLSPLEYGRRLNNSKEWTSGTWLPFLIVLA